MARTEAETQANSFCPVYVAEDNGGGEGCTACRREEAWRLAEQGLGRFRDRAAALGRATGRETVAEMVATFDVHLGTVAEVVASLQADRVIGRATELAVQVHSVDPPHPLILRSLELVAGQVAPALGWAPGGMAEAA